MAELTPKGATFIWYLWANKQITKKNIFFARLSTSKFSFSLEMFCLIFRQETDVLFKQDWLKMNKFENVMDVNAV